MIPIDSRALLPKGFTEVVIEAQTKKSDRFVWLGFVTNMHLEASSPREAKLKGLRLIKKDKELRQLIRNPRHLCPQISADKTDEISSFRGLKRPREGLAFYPSRAPRKVRKQRRSASRHSQCR